MPRPKLRLSRPTICPCTFTRGPPEKPGYKHGVGVQDVLGPAAVLRFLAGADDAQSRLQAGSPGRPRASASCPTWTASGSACGMAGRPVRRDAQQGEVGLGVAPDDGGRQAGPVGEFDGEVFVALGPVGGRQDQAVVGPEDAGRGQPAAVVHADDGRADAGDRRRRVPPTGRRVSKVLCLVSWYTVPLAY